VFYKIFYGSRRACRRGMLGWQCNCTRGRVAEENISAVKNGASFLCVHTNSLIVGLFTSEASCENVPAKKRLLKIACQVINNNIGINTI
jgi:hypothetical protein